jgi:FKBP-type peptidyl-prolyl cis-trans isomerase FklB
MKVKIFVILMYFTFCETVVHGQKLKNGTDSVSYALGILYGVNIQSGGFQLNADIFAQTVQKTLQNEPLDMTPEEANAIVNKQYQKNLLLKYEKNLNEGRAFLNQNKNAPGVVTLPSGLQYKVIKTGKGAIPTLIDRVQVHYRGTLIDGTEFDSSHKDGKPVTFALMGVIAGWTEALSMMPTGSKWMLYVPQELAYGSQQKGQLIVPFSALIFEVELLSIEKQPVRQ